jgi:peptidoglycan/xylan/chitin deacetylase (PgdA/CDA1 family)
VALTFDDGPSESTDVLLRVLEEYHVSATFFQCGMHVRRLPSVTRALVTAGHEIGNHTENHPRLWLRSASFIDGEIARAQQAIESAVGRAPKLFRAPYGVRWFGLRAAQARFGLLGVMWTVIGLDWRLSAGAIAQRVVSGARPGAIICLHDGRESAVKPDIEETIEAVRRIVPELLERGFELETVSALIRR